MPKVSLNHVKNNLQTFSKHPQHILTVFVNAVSTFGNMLVSIFVKLFVNMFVNMSVKSATIWYVNMLVKRFVDLFVNMFVKVFFNMFAKQFVNVAHEPSKPAPWAGGVLTRVGG